MKVTVKQLVSSAAALGELSDTKMPAKAAMSVSMLLRAVRPYVEEFQKVYDALLKEHGTPDPKVEGRFTINNVEAFTEEVSSAQSTEYDIPFEPVSVMIFGDAVIKPNVLTTLDWFITG